MKVNLGPLNSKESNKSAKVRMIGYGTFLQDAIKDLAVGRNPKAWGERIRVLGSVKVEGYRRLWPGKPYYPVIQKADGYFFFGILFEIDEGQLARFDQIEGVPTLYVREMVNVAFKGNIISAYIYIPSKNMLRHTLREYKLAGQKPMFDDWADHLRKTLTPEELQFFPEIFCIDSVYS